MLIPPMSSPVCMACVPASYVDLECKHLFESADVAAAGAQGCSCDSLVYVYLRREQDGVHCLSNLTKIKNNIGNVYSSHCVHIHHVYSIPCVHIHHVYSSTSILERDFVHICGLLGFDLIVRQLLYGEQINSFKVCAKAYWGPMLLGACSF